MIARTDSDTARSVLASKVSGMRTLAPLLLERRLDFVALCSSTAGLVGEPGQVAYCAANAVLDAWSHHLRNAHVPVVSIDWGTWRDVGMAIETELPENLKAWRASTLAGGITPEEGGTAFRLALAAGVPQVVIAPATSSRAANAEAGAGASLSADSSRVAAPGERFARPGLPQQYTAPTTDVQRALVNMWEELLGVEPIGIDDDFFALGGHSLLATRFLANIWRDFAVEMSLAAFFEHPTIAQMADEIVLRQIATYDPSAVEAALAEIKVGE